MEKEIVVGIIGACTTVIVAVVGIIASKRSSDKLESTKHQYAKEIERLKINGELLASHQAATYAYLNMLVKRIYRVRVMTEEFYKLFPIKLYNEPERQHAIKALDELNTCIRIFIDDYRDGIEIANLTNISIGNIAHELSHFLVLVGNADALLDYEPNLSVNGDEVFAGVKVYLDKIRTFESQIKNLSQLHMQSLSNV